MDDAKVREDLTMFREQLRTILDAPEFTSSERVSQFFAYASAMAFEGRSKISQYEIAAQLLHRGEDFDPVDDASVRKLATLTRQRLEKYYSSTGQLDPVLVTLPSRCYIPQFRLRETNASNPPPQPEVGPSQTVETTLPARGIRRGARIIFAAIFLLALAAAIALWWLWWPSGVSREPIGEFVILTKKGDVSHRAFDIAPDAIRLGPRIGVAEEVRVRLSFSPERATQQAGIMIFENPDCYVKLGRQFNSRGQLEFGEESRGAYHKQPGTFQYDPRVQTGAPIWLSIRRDQTEYRAFVSDDGINWRAIGAPISQPQAMPNARVAIYAFNGRTDAPSTAAVLGDLLIGPTFHNWPAETAANRNVSGWRMETNSTEPPSVQFVENALEVSFGMPTLSRWTLMRPAPDGDWLAETQMDFLSAGANSAGMIVIGDKGWARLIRWNLNGGSITMEQFGGNQASLPDFAGSPLIWLRLQRRNDVVTGSFSRDGHRFTTLPTSILTKDLGAHLRFGIMTARNSWSGSGDLAPARFYGAWQRVLTLSDIR